MARRARKARSADRPFPEEKLDQAELGSTQLEDFFPDLVVLWKFFVVRINILRGSDPVTRALPNLLSRVGQHLPQLWRVDILNTAR